MKATRKQTEWDTLQSEVHVWHLSPDPIDPQKLEGVCLHWLTPQETARRGKLLTAPLRHIYLLSRVLCRISLSHYTGVDPQAWTFAENAWGKPFIASPIEWAAPQFNVTHTGGLIACAVTRAGEIGVDAEETCREIDVEGVARLTLSPVESVRFNVLSPEQRKARLFEYWVLKEAYLKALGTGLWKPLTDVTIDLDEADCVRTIDDWQLTPHRPSSHHFAAVAAHRRAGLEPIAIQWREAKECYKLASPS